MNITSERLKALRKAYRMNLEQVSRHVEVSPSAISYYESGKKRPSTDTLLKFCDLYQVSSDYLLGRKDSFDGSPETSDTIKEMLALIEKRSIPEQENILEALKLLLPPKN